MVLGVGFHFVCLWCTHAQTGMVLFSPCESVCVCVSRHTAVLETPTVAGTSTEVVSRTSAGVYFRLSVNWFCQHESQPCAMSSWACTAEIKMEAEFKDACGLTWVLVWYILLIDLFNMAINQNDMFRAVGPWFSDSLESLQVFHTRSLPREWSMCSLPDSVENHVCNVIFSQVWEKNNLPI